MRGQRRSGPLVTLVLALAGAACDKTPGIPSGWALAGRATPVEGATAMVVSGHPLASQVGVEVLQAGGNAIDAAVAVGLALAVVLPEAGNLGGGGYLVHRAPDGTVRTLDFRETAPGAASRDMYLDSLGNPTEGSVVGHLAVGVPGSVAGLFEMHRALGRLSWTQLVEPAIRLAEGHEVDSLRSAHLAAGAERLTPFPASRAQFLPGDSAPPPGARWAQPDLARTLRLLAERGADAFYRGPIADLIVAEMERGGGLITRQDLAAYQPIWREPIQLAYRGHTIYSMAPSSSGGVTLGVILNILEGYAPLPPVGSAELVHLEAEAMRRAFTDRNRYLGDPAFVEAPLARLLSKEYAASLRVGIDSARATPTAVVGAVSEAAHTTHYSMVDAEGNAAAVTTTLNDFYGSGVTVAGGGFLLNDEMDDFAVSPGRPNLYGLVQGEANAIAPGKRMLSSMTPSIVVDSMGQLLLVLGTPGGSTIISSVFRVVSNVIDHRMSLAEAVAAPRVHHQGLPDTIRYEPGGLKGWQVRRLRRMGHSVSERREMSGDIAAILRAPAGGWIGVADPRRGGGARGY